MTDELKSILKKIEGKVVVFGINLNKYIKMLEINDKITFIDILEDISKSKTKIKGKTNTIYINQLRKRYKKHNIDVIICNVDTIENNLINLIKETIYIGKRNIYLFGTKEKVLEALKKYQRYNITYEILDFNEKIIVKIDNSKAKNNFFKDIYYLIIDKIKKLLNLITDILTI